MLVRSVVKVRAAKCNTALVFSVSALTWGTFISRRTLFNVVVLDSPNPSLNIKCSWLGVHLVGCGLNCTNLRPYHSNSQKVHISHPLYPCDATLPNSESASQQQAAPKRGYSERLSIKRGNYHVTKCHFHPSYQDKTT